MGPSKTGAEDFIVLMQSEDASQAVCGSGNIHARCLLPDSLEPTIRRQPPSGPIKDVLRHSALAQYINSQLKFKPSRLLSPDFWRTGAPQEKEASTANLALASTVVPPLRQLKVINASVDTFFQQVGTLDGLRLVFVIDMNRSNLKAGVSRPDEGYYLAERLRERGHLVVQGEPLYREYQRRSQLRLDMGPHDGHLNKIGVGLLMNAAALALKNLINEKEN